MKKVVISLLAGASVLALVACTPKRYERQSKPKTATSSSVKKEKKDTGQKYYQEVLERYAKYDTALKNDDKTGLFAELGKIQSGSEESTYLDALERLGTPVTFQYAFTDLNKDGVDELLVSNQYTETNSMFLLSITSRVKKLNYCIQLIQLRLVVIAPV